MNQRLQGKLAYHPVVFFISFLAANVLLAHGNLALAAQMGVGLFGVFVPLALGLVLQFQKPAFPPASGKKTFSRGEFPPIPGWFIGLSLLVFAFLYSYRLTSVPFWPLMDDSADASYAVHLGQSWDWNPLVPVNKIEAGYFWLLAVFFKCFGASLLTWKLPSALLMAATAGAAYWASRRYFSRSFSFAVAFLFGFQFWSFVVARQERSSALMLLEECLVLGLLGSFLKAPSPARRRKVLVLLAALLITGFYVFTPWAVLAFFTVVVLYRGFYSQKPGTRTEFSLFLASVFLGVLPLALARAGSGGLSYIRTLVGPPAAWDYGICLFWDDRGVSPDGPHGGGLLNPLLGSLALLGILELAGNWKNPIYRAAGFALPLFFLPGALSRDLEIERMHLLGPLLAFLAALGIQALAAALPQVPNRKALALGLLGLAAAPEIYHYWGPYQDWDAFVRNKRHWMSVDFGRAYRRVQAENESPAGYWLLLNLNNKNTDRTLNVALHDRDGAFLPPAARGKIREAVLLANSNYEPFLLRRFPGSRWFWLSPDLPQDHGGLMVGFIPLTGLDPDTLDRFKEADRVFLENDDLYDKWVQTGNLQPVLDDLAGHYDLFKGDPFLESVFWAKIAFYEFGKGDVQATFAALDNALQKGYPAAYLFNEKGVLLAQKGKAKEAGEQFKKALAQPVNRTSALDNLQALEGNKAGP